MSQAFDDVFRRAGLVCELYHLEPAFRMRDHTDSRIARSHLSYMHWKESLVDRTMALPQHNAAVVQGFHRVSTKIFVRIPDWHFFQPQAESISSVPTKVLIGEEQNPVAAFQGPAHHCRSVGRCTDRPIMTATERLNARS